jgi:release factor glutamine methyltransferase
VLIPRVDTEVLVNRAAKEIANQNCKALDLCTGSGCIAISVANHCPNMEITAVDVSKDALEVCRRNIELHNVQDRVQAIQMDILQSTPQLDIQYVLSNPPYIETQTISQLEHSVKDYEPHQALDGGVDGLIFYRRLIDFAKVVKNCRFILEIGYNQKPAIEKIVRESLPHVKDLEFINDDIGHARVALFAV